MNQTQEQYTNKITHFANNPINFGEITQEEAKQSGGKLFVYTHQLAECGDTVTLYWVIDKSTGTILRSRFTNEGSFAARAVFDMLCMILRTKKVAMLESSITFGGLERFLRDNPAVEALPRKERYLVTLAVEAAHKAAERYQEKSQEDPIVCRCKCVPLSRITKAIAEHEIEKMETLQDFTNAGRGCKGCISKSNDANRDYYLDEILEETKAQLQEKKRRFEDADFATLTLDEKVDYINAIIDKNIRQFLIMDGGDMEILDIKENGEHTDVYIRYLGACSGCASSSTGTLYAIETTLKKEIGEQIRVIPI